MTMLVELSEVRAEGVTEEAVDDDRLILAIEQASDFVERACGVPFHVVSFTLDSLATALLLDGPRRASWPTLHLPMPILTLTAAAPVVGGTIRTPYALSGIVAYNRRGVGQAGDRLNPKLVREAGWPMGNLAIALAGTFGWTDPAPEPDPEEEEEPAVIERAPALVRRAVILLVISDFAPLLGDAAATDERLRRWIISETTEGHSYSLGSLPATGPSGLREVDALLRPFHRPTRVRG